jgi:hypothetical protein
VAKATLSKNEPAAYAGNDCGTNVVMAGEFYRWTQTFGKGSVALVWATIFALAAWKYAWAARYRWFCRRALRR